MSMPEWMKKHPCEECGTGYGQCLQGAAISLMCCGGCSHPTRWTESPWTSAEFIEMWQGREMDSFTKKRLRQIIERESQDHPNHRAEWRP